MNRVRGVFPLFLATTFSIVNGIWVFGPAFKDQQREKEERARKELDVVHQSVEAEVKILRNVEAEASRSVAIESALKKGAPSSSWWPSMSLWSKGTPPRAEDSSSALPNQARRGSGKPPDQTS